MIEDMKQQWADAFNPDYVFIDSRTGHTEEGGICTRQLPNAVVVMFFPNEQNLRGIRKVVNDIRVQAELYRREIDLHFVASNVHDLDDEDHILQECLSRFRDELKYREPDLITIHHYASLALLNQEIFITKRPRSRLANEYRALSEYIIERNAKDRDGVLKLLNRLKNNFEPPRATLEDDRILTRIIESHPKDTDIALGVARIYTETGQVQKSKALLDEILVYGHNDAEIFRQRVQVDAIVGEAPDVEMDFLRLLNADGTNFSDALVAISVLSARDPQRLLPSLQSKAFLSLSAKEQLAIGNTLLETPESIKGAEVIFRDLVDHSDDLKVQSGARISLSLCLINAGRYLDAIQLLGPRERLLGEGVEFPDIFNYAMAEWATLKVIPVPLFSKFISALPNDSATIHGANFYQCCAIAYWATGDLDSAEKKLAFARTKIDSASVPTFSAWRYHNVVPSEFRNDLEAIRRMMAGEGIVPEFMQPKAHSCVN